MMTSLSDAPQEDTSNIILTLNKCYRWGKFGEGLIFSRRCTFHNFLFPLHITARASFPDAAPVCKMPNETRRRNATSRKAKNEGFEEEGFTKEHQETDVVEGSLSKVFRVRYTFK